MVTPSRVCELKYLITSINWETRVGHTLTGVWVEMVCFPIGIFQSLSHPHGCVSWNLSPVTSVKFRMKSHPHGCVSWNALIIHLTNGRRSHPHGCVSWNQITLTRCLCQKRVTPSRVCELKYKNWGYAHNLFCHTLTGVWVEMLLVVIYWILI